MNKERKKEVEAKMPTNELVRLIYICLQISKHVYIKKLIVNQKKND